MLGWPFAAGARAALASIWNLNQQATSDLMAQFHAFRADGQDEATAMQSARGTLAAAPQYAHPHYWAGFGVWAGAVPERPGASWLPWAAALALACMLLAWRLFAPRRRG